MNPRFLKLSLAITISLSGLALGQGESQPPTQIPPSGLIWSENLSGKLGEMQITAFGVDDHQLEIVSLDKESGTATFSKTPLTRSGIQHREPTETDPTSGIVIHQSEIATSADQAFFSDGYWFLWDSQGKNLNVTLAGKMDLDIPGESQPDNMIATFPLQFDKVDDILIAGDTVFALGQHGQETFVAMTPLAGLSDTSQWILPGPLPDIRENAQLASLENRLLIVGGRVPSNETHTYPNQVLYTEFSSEGLSSFAPLYNPMLEAPGKSSLAESNQMFFVWSLEDHQKSDSLPLQYTQEVEKNKLGLWESYPIEPSETPMLMASFEAEHQLLMMTESDSGQMFIECFFIPRSNNLDQKISVKATNQKLKQFQYSSITAALRRPNPEQNPFLLVTYPEGSDDRLKLENLFRNPNAQIMMQGVQLTAILDQDKQFLEKLQAEEQPESKIFLIDHKGIVLNATEKLESNEDMFKLLNAIWRPVR